MFTCFLHYSRKIQQSKAKYDPISIHFVAQQAVDDTERLGGGVLPSPAIAAASIVDVQWSPNRTNLLSVALSNSRDLLFFDSGGSNDVRAPIFSRSLPDGELIRAFAWQKKTVESIKFIII